MNLIKLICKGIVKAKDLRVYACLREREGKRKRETEKKRKRRKKEQLGVRFAQKTVRVLYLHALVRDDLSRGI